MKSLKKILLAHPLLKAFSLVFGYSFWLLLANNQITTRSIRIPVCFYNGDAQKLAEPHSVNVIVQGKRNELHNLEAHVPSIHIDEAAIHNQEEITLSESNILLPNTVNVVDYNPRVIHIIQPTE